jgi:translation elongation factor EF-4
MLLFDAYHDEYRGVVCLVEVLDGRVQKGDRITAASTGVGALAGWAWGLEGRA